MCVAHNLWPDLTGWLLFFPRSLTWRWKHGKFKSHKVFFFMITPYIYAGFSISCFCLHQRGFGWLFSNFFRCDWTYFSDTLTNRAHVHLQRSWPRVQNWLSRQPRSHCSHESWTSWRSSKDARHGLTVRWADRLLRDSHGCILVRISKRRCGVPTFFRVVQRNGFLICLL